MKKIFKVGARGSKLSRVQAEGALAFLAQEFPGTKFRLRLFETPGDRDLTTPIEASAGDFFTRDLDDAVRTGVIDFAIHSAKDLPSPISADIDWFRLPGGEDPRDAWVFRAEDERRIRIAGVSGARRAEAAKTAFPGVSVKMVRGAIDARLLQLLAGDFDVLAMAMAGLKRLYPKWFTGDGVATCPVRIEPIPTEVLPPPDGQGELAVTFRAGNVQLQEMRAHFVKAVRFVSAGVGNGQLITLRGAEDLRRADVVLYDDLLGEGLTALAPHARLMHVGKRCGAHSMRQPEITQCICDEARKGRRVVRLKGGDAGLFGRLAEETAALEALQIPFVVRPGVSALTAATTGTGMLLTRRGEARGFSVSTPRSTGSEMTQVLFMATKVMKDEAVRLMRAGYAGTTPVAITYDAAGPFEDVWQTTLKDLAAGACRSGEHSEAGLVIVGSAANRLWPSLGVLRGKRILVTASAATSEDAVTLIEDRGGRPIVWPMIALRGRPLPDVTACDAIVLTSPAAVRIFLEGFSGDVRQLPLFYTCGAGTDAALREAGLRSDLMPEKDFSAVGLIAEIGKRDLRGKRILRLRSALAGKDVAQALRKVGAKVTDVILYDNEPVMRADGRLPAYEGIFFASASAVKAFRAAYGVKAFANRDIYVIGAPTEKALPKAVTPERVTRLKVWEGGRKSR